MLRTVPALVTSLALMLAPVSFALAKPAAPAAPSAHRLFRVTLDPAASAQLVSGRLLLFAVPHLVAESQAHGKPVTRVDTNPFHPAQTAVAAMKLVHLAPGGTVVVDADALAFPTPFSQLAPGAYDIQAVLDINHDYNYSGRGPGDLVSDVVQVHFGDAAGATPSLRLSRALGADTAMQPWALPARVPEKMRQQMQPQMDAARAHSHAIDFVSPALTAFWGRPIHMKGWVLLPPGYDKGGDTRYPTVYFTHGFGGTLASLTFRAASVWKAMANGEIPPMIWVFLDESSATGTHEFADSVNNGPWGTALTRELIPQLEATYRMDGQAGGRFLNGHSSGGWATLWLQVRYPKVFGGTWSTSPDPGDFHDFTGIDLYAPHANVYHKPDGTPWPLVRADGKVVATFEQFAKLERVLGPYGGQMASFDWVFSPRGADGRPAPMFDRDNGDVDPTVVAYWRDHYDIAHRIKKHWPELKPDLDGKIHVIVGTADTFYLDGAAHKLKAVLDGLHANTDIEFLPGKTHGNLYAKGKDRMYLLKQIAWEMYHQARPQAAIPAEWRAAVADPATAAGAIQ